MVTLSTHHCTIQLISLFTGETNLVPMQPFSMRSVTIGNFVTNDQNRYRSSSAYNRSNSNAQLNRYKEEYLLHDPNRSLTILRKLLQKKINSEIDQLLQKYYQQFFHPAIGNIKSNIQNESDATAHEQIMNDKNILHDILDEARKMYINVDDVHESKDKPSADTTNSQHNQHGNDSSNGNQRTRGRPSKTSKTNGHLSNKGKAMNRKRLKQQPKSTSSSSKSSQLYHSQLEIVSHNSWSPSSPSSSRISDTITEYLPNITDVAHS